MHAASWSLAQMNAVCGRVRVRKSSTNLQAVYAGYNGLLGDKNSVSLSKKMANFRSEQSSGSTPKKGILLNQKAIKSRRLLSPQQCTFSALIMLLSKAQL